MNDMGNLYTTSIRPQKSIAQEIPDRLTQYTQQINYNYRVTTLPNCLIGRRHNKPERENDSGAYQAPGVPLHHLDKSEERISSNEAGYVKPSYTAYS